MYLVIVSSIFSNMAPGRPSLKVTIDFNDPIKALDNVKTLFDNKNLKKI